MRDLVPDYVKRLPVRAASGPAVPGEIRLDRNEQPFAPSPRVVEAIQKAAEQANRYPESFSGSLRRRIEQYTGVAFDQIAVGNGSDELIEWIARAFLSNGDEIIVPKPSFFYYATTCGAVGGVTVYADRNPDFTLRIDSIFEKVTDRTKVLYIANPNNPTGTPVPRAEIIEILDRADFLVVVDECYHEFHGETVVDLLPKYPHLLILRSFSKAFGLAALRIGYAMGTPEMIGYLHRVAQSYSVNRMAHAAAIAALDDVEWAKEKIATICEQRDELAAAIREAGYLAHPTRTNFVLVNSKPVGKTSTEIAAELRKAQIHVTDFAGYPGLDEYSFRITIGQPHENAAALRILQQLVLRDR
jgi:histidinol-phosphate aminotransferase